MRETDRTRYGYLKVDHRATGLGMCEYKTLTCSHCERIIVLKMGAVPGGFCRGCMKAICDPCEAERQQRGCVTFLQKIDEVFRRQRMLEHAGVKEA